MNAALTTALFMSKYYKNENVIANNFIVKPQIEICIPNKNKGIVRAASKEPNNFWGKYKPVKNVDKWQ
jgi:hypothetical protein